jgi:hypothetical protein
MFAFFGLGPTDLLFVFLGVIVVLLTILIGVVGKKRG